MTRHLVLLGLGLFLSCTTATRPPADLQADVEHVRALLDDWRGESAILKDARTKLDEILARNPRSAPAHREYARYHIMSGYRKNSEVAPDALQAAEASLNSAFELYPGYADAYVLAGHLYLLQGRNEDAKEALRTAQALGSNDPWLYLNRADIHMVENQPEEAAALYRHVAESGTMNTKAMESALDGLINFYRSRHLDGDADRTYRQLIAYAPESAWNHGNYGGFLLCRMDQFDAAIEQYRIALSMMSYAIATRGLAAALYRKWAWDTNEGEPMLAAVALKEAQSVLPGNPVEVMRSHCRDGGPAIEQLEIAVRLTEMRRKAESGEAIQP